MDSNQINDKSKVTSLAYFSLMCLLFAFGCLLLGYVFVPFAAAFYAAVLVSEKKGARLISYILPLAVFVINIFLNGFYSLEAIVYVVLGLVIYLCFDRGVTKSSLAFILTAIIILFIILSSALYALDALATFDVSSIGEFYVDMYEAFKKSIVSFITSFTGVDEFGHTFYNYNAGDAIEIYNLFILMLIPFLFIVSFVISGLSLKIFTRQVSRIDSEDVRLTDWRFCTAPFLAYSYIVISVLAVLIYDGIFGLSLTFISSIFMFVYFYFGASWIFAVLSEKKGIIFAVMIFLVALVFFSSFAIRLVSYFGVYINNILYQNFNGSKDASL